MAGIANLGGSMRKRRRGPMPQRLAAPKRLGWPPASFAPSLSPGNPEREQAERPLPAPLPAGSTEASWAGSRARSSLSVQRRRDAGPQGSAAAAMSAPQSRSPDTTPGSRAAGTQAVFRTDSPGCARLRGAIDSQVHTSPLLSNSSESPRFEGTPGGHMPQGEAARGPPTPPCPFSLPSQLLQAWPAALYPLQPLPGRVER